MNGTWMQRVAQFWLVLHLTGSGFALGLTAGLQAVPMLLFGTWGGLAADRTDKRVLLVLTQTASGVLGLVLALITLTGAVQLWMVYALALGLGIVNVFDNPGRQSFIVEMVGPEHVANAIGLNSAVFTSSRMLGPALAGLVISAIGTGWCFLVNGLSFFVVVGALLLMRQSELHQVSPIVRGAGQIKDGLRYAWSRPQLRFTLILLLVIGMFAFNWNIVLPLLARYTFNSGAATYGLMLSMIGIGAFAGALFSAGRTRPTNHLFVYSAIAFGTLMLAAAAAPSLTLVLVALVPMGTAMTICQATGNSILQINSEREFRGRIMSLYVTAFLGATPIGGPIAGWVSEELGARAGLALGGLATLIAALVLLPRMNKIVRSSAAPTLELVVADSET
jgi:MFS family permease